MIIFVLMSPRSSTPSLPIRIITEEYNRRTIYILVSDNGYTYHHSDNFWRVYRLKDKNKYIYKTKKSAIDKQKYLTNFLQ